MAVSYDELIDFKKIIGACYFGVTSAVVVVGELKEKRGSLDRHPLTALEFQEFSGIEECILKAFDLQAFYGADAWQTDTENFAVNEILDTLNQEQPWRKFFFHEGLFLTMPNTFELYMATIKRLLSPAKKLLTLDHTGLAEVLLALPEKEVFSGKLEDHPGLAALGMCCVQLSEANSGALPTQEYAITDGEEEVNPWRERFGSAPRQ